jgi:hypothetical protein
MRKTIILGFAMAALGLAHASLDAQQPAARQKYGAWQYSEEKGYHYRKFEYKPNPTRRFPGGKTSPAEPAQELG